MSHLRTAIVSCLGLVAVIAIAHAANRPAPPPQPGSTRLTTALVGRWSGKGELREPGKPQVALAVKLDCQPSSGGWGVRCDASMTGDEVRLLETDLFGYEPSTQKVHWYAVTNAGDVHDHVGSWNGEGELVVRHTGKAGADDLAEDIRLDFAGASGMRFASSTTIAGASAATVTGDLTRQR